MEKAKKFLRLIGKNSWGRRIILYIINEHIMTRLRTIWGLNLKEIKEKFQIDLYSIKKNELNLFKKEKHIEIKNNTIILNKKGKIISDYITEKIML